ncbi:hypothetical protein BHF65_06920 [Ligilactobacillus salivarius]|uniref:Uncharacterized protein n=1 Tax=Ligilactobacillus salivarius TaxID=1624 RepID=A0A1D7TSN3_9LACO|nr:hypothetical protein BHF65_06920 [Ligilactobacillus salivarius]
MGVEIAAFNSSLDDVGGMLELAALEDVAFFSDLILEELDLSFEFEFEQAPSKLSDNKEIVITLNFFI